MPAARELDEHFSIGLAGALARIGLEALGSLDAAQPETPAGRKFKCAGHGVELDIRRQGKLISRERPGAAPVREKAGSDSVGFAFALEAERPSAVLDIVDFALQPLARKSGR